MASQLTPHNGTRVELATSSGPLAALRAVAGVQDAPVALLVPGFTGSKEDFAPLLDPITADGVDALAIDLPGQYESPGPDDETAYLPAALGSLVAELIGKLAADGRRVLLLGHSYGGLVSRAAVLAGVPIVGLTLLDSGPGELPVGLRRQVLDILEPVLRTDGPAATARLRDLLDAKNPNAVALPAQLRAFLHERFVRTSLASLLGMANGLRTEPDLVGILARTLRATGTPCLVACGEADDAWPVSVQRDMADRLDADFAVIPDARHTPNVDNPEGLLATLLPTWRSWLA